jgi:hypothetical protein
MVARERRSNKFPNFVVGSLVKLKIPKPDRPTVSMKRLICRIIAEKSPGHFTLQSKYGVINRSCVPYEMEIISDLISFPEAGQCRSKPITVRSASKIENEGNHGPVRNILYIS